MEGDDIKKRLRRVLASALEQELASKASQSADEVEPKPSTSRGQMRTSSRKPERHRHNRVYGGKRYYRYFRVKNGDRNSEDWGCEDDQIKTRFRSQQHTATGKGFNNLKKSTPKRSSRIQRETHEDDDDFVTPDSDDSTDETTPSDTDSETDSSSDSGSLSEYEPQAKRQRLNKKRHQGDQGDSTQQPMVKSEMDNLNKECHQNLHDAFGQFLATCMRSWEAIDCSRTEQFRVKVLEMILTNIKDMQEHEEAKKSATNDGAHGSIKNEYMQVCEYEEAKKIATNDSAHVPLENDVIVISDDSSSELIKHNDEE